MIRRYEQTDTRKTKSGKSFHETQLLPDVERRPSDVIITVDTQERLDRLAFRYYDDAKLWWVIASANNLGRGDWIIPAGSRIRIPQNLSEVNAEITDINDKR